MPKQKRILKVKKCFTLIELLVVLGIIGILTSITLVSVNAGRLKARDAQRKSDIAQMAKALQVYYLDYGLLPTPGQYGENDFSGWDVSMDGTFLKFLAGTPAGFPGINNKNIKYFNTAPIDLKNNACNHLLTLECGGATPAYGYRYAFYRLTGSCNMSGRIISPPFFRIDYRLESTKAVVINCFKL